MLKQRIITAMVLIPPLLAALFLLPVVGIAILFGVLIALAAWEWGALCELPRIGRSAYALVLVTIGGVVVAAAVGDRRVGYAVFAIAGIWWVWVAARLFFYPDSLMLMKRARLIAGALTLVPAWTALVELHAIDARRPLLLLFILVMVGVADTAAYFAGHAFGRTKLAPTVSPGKTVEGVLGGAVGVVLLSYFCGTMLWHFAGRQLAAWVGMTVLAGLVSVVGDLSESKLKRVAGVKDSGTLLPGHGGILDRIDAVTAAAPVFTWGWLLLFDVHR
jgi:phosphatidate cytidylyltransferase